MASLTSPFSCLTAFLLFMAVSLSSSESERVNLSIYYDTLSPSCETFIVKKLARIFDQDLITIVNLRLVPWANSTFCQEGGDKCMLNTMQACSIDVWHDVNKQFGFIYCMEFLAIEGRQKAWNTCFSSLGLPQIPILDCYNTGNGTKLMRRYADEVAKLNPPPTLVPWVMVNNQPLENDYENFAAYICKAYKGGSIPMACK